MSYSISDLNGRMIYSTPNGSPEYYESNVEGQLLDGFKILVNNFQKGDSFTLSYPLNICLKKKVHLLVKFQHFVP